MTGSLLNCVTVRTLPVVLLCLVLAACGDAPEQEQPDVRRFSGPTMGTAYNITLVAGPGGRFPFDDAELQAAVDAELQLINRHMSTYIPDSELMVLNAADVGEWHAISEPMSEVLRVSRRISELTEGAFDITVGPLVNLWGFGPDPDRDRFPDAAGIEAVMERVGYRYLEVDSLQVRKQVPMFIDLSGVAKGYGADWLGRFLEARGVINYLVDIGGDLRVRGVNRHGTPWRIAIETPSAERSDIQRVVNISDAALVTSGDYRNFREIDGRRRSHIIDPATGHPVEHDLVSVTVIAATAAEADALATAFMVMGAEAALALAERENIAVFLIERREDGFEETYSSAFAPYL